MQIILCGADFLGLSLIHFLSLNYDLVVIDPDPSALLPIKSRYDVQTLVGSASDPHILDEIDFNPRTHVIGATPFDEVNLVACTLSKMFSPVATTLVRLENPSYTKEAFSEKVKKLFSLDMVFSSHDFFTQGILMGLEHPYAFDSFPLLDGLVILLGLSISPMHPWIGQSLEYIEACPDLSLRFTHILRGQHIWMAQGEEKLEEKDGVYILVHRGSLRAIQELWKASTPLQSVVFLGSSPLLFSLLPLILSKGLRIRILSNNEEDLLAISQEYPSVQLFQGSSVDPHSLRTLPEHPHCCSVSLGPSDRENIFSAIMAQSHGFSFTMACLQNLAYGSPLGVQGMGRRIHPAPGILNVLLKKIRKRPEDIIYPLQGLDSGFLIQGIVRAGAKIKETLAKDWTDDRWRILALYRKGEAMDLSHRIQEGDHVLVAALPNGYEAFLKIFDAPLVTE